MKAIVVIALTVASIVSSLGGGHFSRDFGLHPTDGPLDSVDWWFDPVRGSICWVGKRASYGGFDIAVDLDGNHDTGFSSFYSALGSVGNYTAPYYWAGNGGGGLVNESGSGPSLLSDVAVYPPWPHYRFPILGGHSEWFHPFVTKRTPPTDWIVGFSDDDGYRSFPITKPFWVSFDFGTTWTEYDPSAFTGPTGECKEDLPPQQTLEAEIDFDPNTLNPRSRGRWVTVYVELPKGHDPRDIDAATIRLNDTLAPVLDPKYGFVSDPAGYITDHDGDGLEDRVVKFDRAAVIALFPAGTYPVRITGLLVDGTGFAGLSDPIRVLA